MVIYDELVDMDDRGVGNTYTRKSTFLQMITFTGPANVLHSWNELPVERSVVLSGAIDVEVETATGAMQLRIASSRYVSMSVTMSASTITHLLPH